MVRQSGIMAIFAALVCAAATTAGAAAAPRWISGGSAQPESPAPVLLKEFVLDAKPAKAVFTVAVAGWSEVSVNGEKVGRDVLSPVTCQPDKRTSSLDFDVTDLLRPGTNTLEVLLGNGWQNSFTLDAWGFCDAPWIGAPRICGEFVLDGRTLFVTDGDTTAHGLDADFSVSGFTVDQPLDEAVTVKVVAKPTASDRAPVWV